MASGGYTKVLPVLCPTGADAVQNAPGVLSNLRRFSPTKYPIYKKTGTRPVLLYMAHSGGFEPPTARFVAEYSIQLSYECVILKRVSDPSMVVGSGSHVLCDQQTAVFEEARIVEIQRLIVKLKYSICNAQTKKPSKNWALIK